MPDYPFNFNDIQPSWALCFNDSCPHREHCMRHFAGRHLPNGRLIGPAVYPKALQDDRCQYFVEKRVVRAAWGFSQLFKDIKLKDNTQLRNSIKSYLGGHGTYYRYMKGERTLSPEQQEWILDLFRRHGYTDNLVFDHYKDRWNFD